jgi:hypothetical protein
LKRAIQKGELERGFKNGSLKEKFQRGIKKGNLKG